MRRDALGAQAVRYLIGLLRHRGTLSTGFFWGINSRRDMNEARTMALALGFDRLLMYFGTRDLARLCSYLEDWEGTSDVEG